MTSYRNTIAEFLEEAGVDQAYRAADVLVGRLSKLPVKEGTTTVDITGFSGRNDADLLIKVACWLEAEHRVLIGLWSTGFGGPLDTHLQVISERDQPAEVS